MQVSLPQSVVAGSERVRISVVGKYNQYYNTLKSAHVVTSITDPFRLSVSFVRFPFSVRLRFVCVIRSFISCIVCFVYRSFRSSV